MTSEAFQLLRRLEPPVRPTGTPGPQVQRHAPLEHQGFDQLLSLVSAGRVSTGREVAAPTDLELTPDQLQRLGSAADLAEGAGAHRALLLMDGRGLVLDVGNRAIDHELTATEDQRLVDLDLAVYVAGDDDPVPSAAVAPPGTGLVPAHVARGMTPPST